MDTSTLHILLLLSDTALPLGSFAFSSGLESFLAHNRLNHATRTAALDQFLNDSLDNLASTALPYVLAAHCEPSQLSSLDNDFDASTPCTVARRASTSQGRALITVWDRALSTSARHEHTALTAFCQSIKQSKPGTDIFQLNAHFAPLFGAVCRALGVSLQQTTHLFLLNHAKAVLSAAVRASVFGPYQSQSILASPKLQTDLETIINRHQARSTDEAAVTVPAMDIWMGRHELLYSRIFNS